MKENKITYKPGILWKFRKAYSDKVAEALQDILYENGIEGYLTGETTTLYSKSGKYPGDIVVYRPSGGCVHESVDRYHNPVYRFSTERLFTKEQYPLPKHEVICPVVQAFLDELFEGDCIFPDMKWLKEVYDKRNAIRVEKMRKLDDVMEEIVGELNDKEIFKRMM